MTRRWETSDIQYLKAWYGQIPFVRIKAHLRREEDDIHGMAEALGLRVRPADKPKRPHGRPPGSGRDTLTTPKSESIRKAIAELPKPRARTSGGQAWSEQDDSVLRNLASNGFTHEEIGEYLGRPTHAITSRLSVRNIHAPPGSRNNPLVRVIYKARYYLRRDDHLTALHVIEQAIKKLGDKTCSTDTTT